MIKNLKFPLIAAAVSVSLCGQVSADFDLLTRAAIASPLAAKSVLITAIANDDQVITAGERGHIITWKNQQDWQQHQVPVSTTITSLTLYANQQIFATGHDATILRAEENQWQKVFDGYQLIDLKKSSISDLIAQLKSNIDTSTDPDMTEELEFQMEELEFALEDLDLEAEEGPNKPLLSIANSKQRLFATGAYGTLLMSEDQGNNWQLIDHKLPNPEQFHLNQITATSDGQLYIVGESGSLFHSADTGETWRSIDLPYSGSLFGLIVNPRNRQQLIAFGLQGHYMVSENGGESWSSHKAPTSASFLGGTITENKVFLVGHGGLIAQFPVSEPKQLKLRKHDSGATLSSVIAEDDHLVLVGQNGITRWQIQ